MYLYPFLALQTVILNILTSLFQLEAVQTQVLSYLLFVKLFFFVFQNVPLLLNMSMNQISFEMLLDK